MEHNHFQHHFLKVQYRMHPKIADFPNKMFYDGELMNGRNVLERRDTPLLNLEVFKKITNKDIAAVQQKRFGPLVWLDTCSVEFKEREEMTERHSKFSMLEIKMISIGWCLASCFVVVYGQNLKGLNVKVFFRLKTVFT